MNNRILILSAIIICATLTGCDKKHESVGVSGASPSPYFVHVYTVPNDMNIFIQGKIDGEIPYDVIKISFPGERIDMMGNHTEEGKDEFRKLAQLYNDVSYNDMVVPFSNRALSVPLNSITMTCDRDFDAAHGAGDPLNDIVTLYAWSPYEFIQRGYKSIPKPDDMPEELKWYYGSYGYDLLRLPLSEVNAETAKMLDGGLLIFSKKPDAGGEYTFTVTAEINGKTHSKQIGYTFE